MSKLNGNSILTAAWDVQTQRVGGESVIFRSSTGEYFALDEVGSFLWNRIVEKPIGLHWLIEAIVQKYNCTFPKAQSDVIEFCGQLYSEKLLTYCQHIEGKAKKLCKKPSKPKKKSKTKKRT